MRTKKLYFVILLFLLVGVAAAIIGLTVKFFSDIKASGEVITNGQVINIEKSGTYEIYCQASMPPEMSSYPFRFTNTQTNEVIASTSPAYSKSYSVNSLVINSEIKRGTFGQLVALVELDAGAYAIQFVPAEDGSVFVWGNNSLLIMLQYIISLLMLGSLLLIIFCSLIFIGIKIATEKKAA